MGETATLTQRAFRSLAYPEPSPELHEWIMTSIRIEANQRRRRRRLRRYAALGLTALLALVAIAHGGAY